MVVKSRVGRKRYVIFQVQGRQTVLKRDLIHTINKMIYVRPSNKPIKKDSRIKDHALIHNDRSGQTNSSFMIKGDNKVKLSKKDTANNNKDHYKNEIIKNTNDSRKLLFNENWPFRATPWVIFIKDNIGLIRCHHKDKEKTIKLLQSIQWIGGIDNQVKIITFGTTGTIRSARKKYLDKLILYPFSNVYKM
jgi:RNase P/RNase MRP subunit POP5